MANGAVQTGQNGSGKGGGGNKAIVIVSIIVVVAVIAVLGIVAFVMLRPKAEESTPVEEAKPGKRNVVVTPDNVDEVITQMAESEFVEPGYFETSMTNEWHFPEANSASPDAYVANVAGNTNDIYFDVVLAEDENRVIYSSPVIPIGASLKDLTLDAPLENGTYDCVVIYHLVDEDQNTVSTLRVTVTVIIGQ
jgi:hypothetical protein